MGSPVTLSGFNNIDFSSILSAVMQQERRPVTLLETQQTVLTAQKSAFSDLASKLSALQSAADDLTSFAAYRATTASVSDESRISASSSSSAPEGTYRITVSSLARAQVSLISRTATLGYADKDQTIIATGGTISFGTDRTVTISGDVTLEGLATAINNAGVGASASVVKNTGGYHLMLTGQETGAASAFAVTNSLQGALAGRAASTKQTAVDAQILMNGVTITSTTNTFSDVIPDASFTVLREDAANPVIVTITASDESLKELVQKIVTAFNDIVGFLNQQQQSAKDGDEKSIGRDPLVRTLRRELTSTLIANNSSGGGVYTALAQIGFTISRTGDLSLDEAKLTSALSEHREDVQKLFYGISGSDGLFGQFESVIQRFTQSGGLLPNVQERLSDQASKLADRIAEMEARLEIKRAALQAQFTAADLAIAQLNQQGSQISRMSTSWSY